MNRFIIALILFFQLFSSYAQGTFDLKVEGTTLRLDKENRTSARFIPKPIEIYSTSGLRGNQQMMFGA